MQFGESGFAFIWLAICNRLLSALTKYFFAPAFECSWKLINIVRCYGHKLCSELCHCPSSTVRTQIILTQRASVL